ncbi:single-stranded DNA-binding protein [Priestia aryabhattai]|uniref:single-stranded DNA-binding protein n=1 Tax=Priestia aryabhattai TaxID=412384 RepID=UPI00203AB0A6|nr:single-stranded DNA-binding protein [Priestia aryabhattai]MCM3774001.1 single-stranded DNA-binding protein [Priestia aryabhattai]
MAIITVCGNVGNAEFRYSPNGHPVLTVSIADKRWNFKDEKEETYWIRAVWFGERAEKLANSIPKAKVISVTGKEAYKIYEGKIDRSIDPLDHTILQFKANDDTSPRNDTNQQQEESYPPPSDKDIPFL